MHIVAYRNIQLCKLPGKHQLSLHKPQVINKKKATATSHCTRHRNQCLMFQMAILHLAQTTQAGTQGLMNSPMKIRKQQQKKTLKKNTQEKKMLRTRRRMKELFQMRWIFSVTSVAIFANWFLVDSLFIFLVLFFKICVCIIRVSGFFWM